MAIPKFDKKIRIESMTIIIDENPYIFFPGHMKVKTPSGEIEIDQNYKHKISGSSIHVWSTNQANKTVPRCIFLHGNEYDTMMTLLCAEKNHAFRIEIWPDNNCTQLEKKGVSTYSIIISGAHCKIEISASYVTSENYRPFVPYHDMSGKNTYTFETAPALEV